MSDPTPEPDAPEPAEVEATGEETVDITFEGHAYTIPAGVDDLDIDVLRAFERGASMGIVDALLGGQMKTLERRYRKDHEGRFPQRALKPFVDEIARVYGFDPGE